jgi:hypothetical protein
MYLRRDIPPNAGLFFGAVFGDPAPISFRERAPQSSAFKIPTVSRRSGLLPPGVVQITTVDRVEADVVDNAKHYCFGVQRIAKDRECYPTHWLSSMPRSIASMRPSRSSGW